MVGTLAHETCGIIISVIFIKDLMDKEELSILYSPTHMKVDYCFKNPLQGA